LRFNTLQQWLDWQETLHFTEIELGLQRASQVYQRLYSESFPVPVVSVAGTNGKGSSIAMLESIYSRAGYRVGCYTSPHIFKYNERICINQQVVSDKQLCESFARIDAARQLKLTDTDKDISLTYFEFGTLAAFDIFQRAAKADEIDIILLEVGLGGRLDVVNLIDTDVALITSIGLDHTQWLGDTREAIGYEKAGIMRSNTPVVYSGTDIPDSIQQHADSLPAPIYVAGRDFHYQHKQIDWQWTDGTMIRGALPRPTLMGEHQYQNAAGVLKVVELLRKRLPVNQAHVRQGLMDTQIDGRCQVIPADKTVILDVAHNPDSIQALAKILQQLLKENLQANKASSVYAIVGMMKDKSLLESLLPLAKIVKHWALVKPAIERAAEPGDLASIVRTFEPASQHCYEELETAFSTLQSKAKKGDIIVVFGSFYTIAGFKSEWISA